MLKTREEWISETGKQGREKDLLLRAYDTLTANTYSPDAGFLWSPYRCITPGKGSFPGIWNWDTAFHSVGISRWDTELAKEGIFGFFKFQKENGFLPDVIWERGEIVDTFSKPPVFAWCCEIVYKREKDIAFLEKMYPKLIANMEFWEKERSYNGLFYYNADDPSTDDYLIRVKYESGWDNSPRFDETITDLWPIDLNCFMVMTYRSLSYIANELGHHEESTELNEKAENLSDLIISKMWDDEMGLFGDVNKLSEKATGIISPASFMPLYIKIASSEQALKMGKIAETELKNKMPTINYAHPAYSNDYWRGPTWLNVAYFAAKGLKNYDHPSADIIKENILSMCDREKRGIFENYDSVTGKGLYCDHFSWSSVFIIEFIMNF